MTTNFVFRFYVKRFRKQSVLAYKISQLVRIFKKINLNYLELSQVFFPIFRLKLKL